MKAELFPEVLLSWQGEPRQQGTTMNKIILVGHPQSRHRQVLARLCAAGMAPALPSRRDQLTAQQISTTLARAHGVGAIEQLDSAAEVPQIQVAPAWRGMALDLLLGNLEQPLWGWGDPQAACLLDYWSEQDPRALFVLVYDEPQSAHTRLPLEVAAAEPEELRRRLDAWVGFNSALLSFHLRKPGRSVLVHAERALADVAGWLQALNPRLETPLRAPAASWQGQATPALAAEAGAAGPLVSEQAPLVAAGPDETLAFLANLLVEQHRQSRDLYEEMQAAATLPRCMAVAAHEYSEPSAAGWQHPDLAARQRAWQACVTQLQRVQDLARHSTGLDAELAKLRTELVTSTGENELLLTQLHQVQEELERHYLQGKKQASELRALKEAEQAAQKELKAQKRAQSELKTKLEQATEQLEAEKRKKSGLQKKLEQAQQDADKRARAQKKAEKANAALKEENDLLLAQLHQVQEELERYYLENRKLKDKLRPKPVYGAAERVKRQLSYRLGATMIARSHSLRGWLGMPFALRREVREFRLEQNERTGRKLPPIANYADAAEAEQLRAHLSYRLGATMIARSQSLRGWLGMPWALRAEARNFRENRQESLAQVAA